MLDRRRSPVNLGFGTHSRIADVRSRQTLRPIRPNALADAHACSNGEKAPGIFLIQQGRLVAANVEGVVVRNSGHWLTKEAHDQVVPKLLEFLNR